MSAASGLGAGAFVDQMMVTTLSGYANINVVWMHGSRVLDFSVGGVAANLPSVAALVTEARAIDASLSLVGPS